MDTIDRIARIEQRIAELDAGKEIDAKHINVLLSKNLGIPFGLSELREGRNPPWLPHFVTNATSSKDWCCLPACSVQTSPKSVY